MADTGYSYVAARALTIGGVRAYTPGQEVPDSVVAGQGWVTGVDVIAAGTPVPALVPAYVGNATIRAALSFDTAANWAATNPVLGLYERGFDTTNGNERIGDGVTAWSSLPLAQSATYVAGRKVSTDGSHGLPTPSGSGLEFVFTAAGLDDIRYDGVSQ